MTSLEQQLQASVDLLACVVKPTVTEAEIESVHAQLDVVCERVKVICLPEEEDAIPW